MDATRRNILLAGAAALPLAPWLANALNAQPPANPGIPGAAGGEDPLLASCLLTKGRRQIEICRIAQTQAQNEDVKAFLKAEIEEHETIKANLKKLGFEPPTPAAARNQPAAPAGAREPAAVSVGQVVIPPPASQLIQTENEVVDQCIANFKTKLQQKMGVKADKCIVGDQLHEHYALLDHATVFSKHASEKMQPILKEGVEVITKHIATLEQMMEKLESAKG
jgi:sulfur carrier protein ThiS